MEETEIQSVYSNSRPSVAPSRQPATDALPFRAGVLTQRAGHFTQIIKYGSSQRSVTGIVQKAAHVGSCTGEKSIQSEKPPCEGAQQATREKGQLAKCA